MSQTSVMLADRYRLEDQIAAGGMGEVWRATDLVLGRAVAVKLLRAGYAGRPETLARFRAEARRAGLVSHPGIAQVYDYGEAERYGPPFLVMELVDGPSLAGLLAAGPLSPVDTMDVVAQTAAALAAAHVAGLVHRDIKPANLLLGPGGIVKITDFGIAHAAGSAPLTAIGTLVGTPAYLAPERAAGSAATPASDLYSLGVVTHECLAGVPPFTGTPLPVTTAHQHRRLPPLPAAVPDGVAALVTELTAHDPAARPASANAVATRAGHLRDALTRGQAGQPSPGRHSPRPAAPAAVDPATLTEIPLADLAAGQRRGWRDRAWPGLGVLLALAATAVLVGLAGWLLAGRSGPAPPRHAAVPRVTATATASAAATATASPAVRTVDLNGGSLAGQPVSAVRERLRQLGLVPRVVWVPAAQQPPGAVVSVRPAGYLAPGSTVIVTGAYRPHRHQQDNGQGGGNGGD